MAVEGSRKAIIAAFLANLGIALSKFVGFAFTQAASMLAEAVHSVADSGNQGLLILGSKRARRVATKMHPFGFGGERYFWAFVVAVVLFTVGGVFAVYEGIEKLRHPHAVESIGWAVGVLGIAIVLEALSFRTAIIEASHLRGRQSWWSFIRNAKAPELPVVLLEDLGALVGLVFALLGVVSAKVFHQPRFDAGGSIAIGTLLIAIAIVVAVEMKSLLIGESASEGEEDRIVEAISKSPGVRKLLNLRTLHLGPEELLVVAKIEPDNSASGTELADVINTAERRVREAVVTARIIYIEPDIYDPRLEKAPLRSPVAGHPADAP